MIRSYNFTGRRSLPRDCIHIVLYEGNDGVAEFEAHLDLIPSTFPPTAIVYLEAYYKSSMMRFSFGPVANAHEQAGRRFPLNEIQNSIAFFRLKIVDEREATGRLIAQVDKIAPALVDQSRAAKTSLLYVQYEDIQDRIWQLDITTEHAMPILKVNSTLNTDIPIQELVSRDPLFMSLVFPVVVERVLGYVLFDDQEPDDEPNNWKNLWIRFAQSLPGVSRDFDLSHDGDEESKLEWIETVVQGFCKSQNIKGLFVSAFQRQE